MDEFEFDLDALFSTDSFNQPICEWNDELLAKLKDKIIATDVLINLYKTSSAEVEQLKVERTKLEETKTAYRQELQKYLLEVEPLRKKCEELSQSLEEAQKDATFKNGLIAAHDSVLKQYTALVSENEKEVQELKDSLKKRGQCERIKSLQIGNKYKAALKHLNTLSSILKKNGLFPSRLKRFTKLWASSTSLTDIEDKNLNAGLDEISGEALSISLPPSVSSLDTGFDSTHSETDSDAETEGSLHKVNPKSDSFKIRSSSHPSEGSSLNENSASTIEEINFDSRPELPDRVEVFIDDGEAQHARNHTSVKTTSKECQTSTVATITVGINVSCEVLSTGTQTEGDNRTRVDVSVSAFPDVTTQEVQTDNCSLKENNASAYDSQTLFPKNELTDSCTELSQIIEDNSGIHDITQLLSDAVFCVPLLSPIASPGDMYKESDEIQNHPRPRESSQDITTQTEDCSGHTCAFKSTDFCQEETPKSKTDVSCLNKHENSQKPAYTLTSHSSDDDYIRSMAHEFKDEEPFWKGLALGLLYSRNREPAATKCWPVDRKMVSTPDNVKYETLSTSACVKNSKWTSGTHARLTSTAVKPIVVEMPKDFPKQLPGGKREIIYRKECKDVRKAKWKRHPYKKFKSETIHQKKYKNKLKIFEKQDVSENLLAFNGRDHRVMEQEGGKIQPSQIKFKKVSKICFESTDLAKSKVTSSGLFSISSVSDCTSNTNINNKFSHTLVTEPRMLPNCRANLQKPNHLAQSNVEDQHTSVLESIDSVTDIVSVTLSSNKKCDEEMPGINLKQNILSLLPSKHSITNVCLKDMVHLSSINHDTTKHSPKKQEANEKLCNISGSEINKEFLLPLIGRENKILSWESETSISEERPRDKYLQPSCEKEILSQPSISATVCPVEDVNLLEASSLSSESLSHCEDTSNSGNCTSVKGTQPEIRASDLGCSPPSKKILHCDSEQSMRAGIVLQAERYEIGPPQPSLCLSPAHSNSATNEEDDEVDISRSKNMKPVELNNDSSEKCRNIVTKNETLVTRSNRMVGIHSLGACKSSLISSAEHSPLSNSNDVVNCTTISKAQSQDNTPKEHFDGDNRNERKILGFSIFQPDEELQNWKKNSLHSGNAEVSDCKRRKMNIDEDEKNLQDTGLGNELTDSREASSSSWNLDFDEGMPMCSKLSGIDDDTDDVNNTYACGRESHISTRNADPHLDGLQEQNSIASSVLFCTSNDICKKPSSSSNVDNLQVKGVCQMDVVSQKLPVKDSPESCEKIVVRNETVNVRELEVSKDKDNVIKSESYLNMHKDFEEKVINTVIRNKRPRTSSTSSANPTASQSPSCASGESRGKSDSNVATSKCKGSTGAKQLSFREKCKQTLNELHVIKLPLDNKIEISKRKDFNIELQEVLRKNTKKCRLANTVKNNSEKMEESVKVHSSTTLELENSGNPFCRQGMRGRRRIVVSVAEVDSSQPSANLSVQEETLCNSYAPVTSKQPRIAHVPNKNIISKNKTDVAKNDSDVAKNDSDVAKNDSDVAKNDSDVTKNDSDVAKNDSDVVKNNSDEAKNDSLCQLSNEELCVPKRRNNTRSKNKINFTRKIGCNTSKTTLLQKIKGQYRKLRNPHITLHDDESVFGSKINLRGKQSAKEVLKRNRKESEKKKKVCEKGPRKTTSAEKELPVRKLNEGGTITRKVMNGMETKAIISNSNCQSTGTEEPWKESNLSASEDSSSSDDHNYSRKPYKKFNNSTVNIVGNRSNDVELPTSTVVDFHKELEMSDSDEECNVDENEKPVHQKSQLCEIKAPQVLESDLLLSSEEETLLSSSESNSDFCDQQPPKIVVSSSPVEQESCNRDNKNNVVNEKTHDYNVATDKILEEKRMGEPVTLDTLSQLSIGKGVFTSPWIAARLKLDQEYGNQLSAGTNVLTASLINYKNYCALQKKIKKEEVKHKKIKKEKVKSFLETYLSGDFSVLSFKEATKSVFRSCQKEFAKYIVQCIRSLKEEPYDFTRTPPAPPMTETQRRLLTLLVTLGKYRSSIPELVMERLQYVLLHWQQKVYTDSAFHLARFYTAMCKMQHNRSKILALCFDAVYCLKNKAHLVILAALTAYPEAFPRADSLESGCSLMQTFLHFIYNKGNSEMIKAWNLKNIMTTAYGYKETHVISLDDLLQRIFDEVRSGSVPEVEQALLMLIKRNDDWSWVYNQVIVGGLIPIINDWTKGRANETAACLSIRVLGYVGKSMPVANCKFAEPIINVLERLLFSDLGSQVTQESLLITLSLMVKFDTIRIFSILRKWKREEEYSDEVKSIIMNVILSQRNVHWWNQFLEDDAFKKSVQNKTKVPKKGTIPKKKLDAT